MNFRTILRLNVRHDYFGDVRPPMELAPTDLETLERIGCLFKFIQGAWCVVTDRPPEDLPAQISFDLRVLKPEVLPVTKGSDLDFVPLIEAPLGTCLLYTSPSPRDA